MIEIRQGTVRYTLSELGCSENIKLAVSEDGSLVLCYVDRMWVKLSGEGLMTAHDYYELTFVHPERKITFPLSEIEGGSSHVDQENKTITVSESFYLLLKEKFENGQA